ncbi:MAG: phage antirepressor protein [Planctomycetes bacterium RBG_13_46_10]|nr:MAG: phage antirepressor protein [Planctomycetes bacterium RBG_13_46_10]
MANELIPTTKIAVFRGKQIRKTLYKGEWCFSIGDVVEVLTDTPNSADYIKKMRKRDPELAKGWGQIVTPLLVETDGGPQKVNCANTEGVFRIIQSIPSPKAEPFKRWLARVGYERVQEIEDPELATKRTRAIYKAKGYSDNWIEKRMRGIAIREELTDEWKKRDVKEEAEYAILTFEISKATFGLTLSQYKRLKRLKRENLRDHMNDLELIFSMLGEAATTEITRTKDAQGFIESKDAAKQGGEVAGKARKDLESKTGKRVVSKQNYLQQSENRKFLRGNK